MTSEGNRSGRGLLGRVSAFFGTLWRTVGIVLLLLLLTDAVLDEVLDDGWADEQIVAGAKMPSREASDAYAGVAWQDAYRSEHRAAKDMRWEPYLYWRRKAFGGEHIFVNEQGERRTWALEPAPAAATVWVFGGSTIWGTGVTNEETVPSWLARHAANQGMSLNVRNLGESGYVSTQGVIALLRELQRGERPDVVVFYDGVNDVFAALQAQQAGIPQNEVLRQLDFAAGRGNVVAWALRHLQGIAKLTGTARPDIDVSSLADSVAETYQTNMRAVAALGEQFGFDAFFFWQPSVFSRDHPTAFEQRIIDASWRTHRALQVAATAEVRMRLAEQDRFVDLSSGVDGARETVYLDFAHLGPRGNEIVAREIFHQIQGAWNP